MRSNYPSSIKSKRIYVGLPNLAILAKRATSVKVQVPFFQMEISNKYSGGDATAFTLTGYPMPLID